MPVRIVTRLSARSTQARSTGVWGGVVLLAACGLLLWVNRGFGVYALTGFLWPSTNGVVVSPRRTSSPMIQFQTRDGGTEQFTEDYILLCGSSRDFCWIRNFDPGQVVPVVYDPARATRAYVRDFALYSNVVLFFLELGCGLFIGLILCVALFKRPITYSVQVGGQGSGQ